ncbi:unnamed protein product [Pleuronectes platessa]|uniref:Uncharacterized protein n=1 Tax=Pleuronectes platessa TaxID=8262 RepID=A0A9N7VXH9_PLEPL|nr:unnamed protein product [Pleuronectes platessa]
MPWRVPYQDCVRTDCSQVKLEEPAPVSFPPVCCRGSVHIRILPDDGWVGILKRSDCLPARANTTETVWPDEESPASTARASHMSFILPRRRGVKIRIPDVAELISLSVHRQLVIQCDPPPHSSLGAGIKKKRVTGLLHSAPYRTGDAWKEAVPSSPCHRGTAANR